MIHWSVYCFNNNNNNKKLNFKNKKQNNCLRNNFSLSLSFFLFFTTLWKYRSVMSLCFEYDCVLGYNINVSVSHKRTIKHHICLFTEDKTNVFKLKMLLPCDRIRGRRGRMDDKNWEGRRRRWEDRQKRGDINQANILITTSYLYNSWVGQWGCVSEVGNLVQSYDLIGTGILLGL